MTERFSCKIISEETTDMPLRDHFRPPLANIASWEELHGMWPVVMVQRLNQILPPEYRSGVKIHLGSAVELDLATFQHETEFEKATNSEFEWQTQAPTLLLETDELSPPEYEVRVYDQRASKRLVAVVELISPANKDRAESRDAFVSKCHALLQENVCLVLVDPVTNRNANLFALLAERLGAKVPGIANETTYTVTCRARRSKDRIQIESWEHPLRVGRVLPTLPLWLNETRKVPLELEQTYEESCRGMRII